MPESSKRCNRRTFLDRTIRAALPLAAASTLRAQEAQEEPDPRPLVVKAWSPRAADSLLAHPNLLRELLEESLIALVDTNARTASEAWHALLKPEDVIGIKFNQSGAHRFQTTPELAQAIVRSLTNAGWPPEQLVLIEVPTQFARDLKTQPARIGWSEETFDFGSGKEQLSAVLEQVTALINVPFLKTHNIAGMTGCLKNLSHALIRRPGRYHANGCLPFIPDIVALPAIRDKLKLNIMNAVRAVWDGGPDVQTRYIFEASALLISTDPVATDSVGVDLIDQVRAAKRVPPLGGKEGLRPFWQAAAQRELGIAHRDLIRRRSVRI